MRTFDEQRVRLTRNAAYLTVASIGQKVLSFSYVLVFANLVGTAVTGAYFFVLSFANLFGIIVDAGLSPILIRDVARQPERAREFFQRTVRFKIVTAFIALGLIIIIAPHVISSPLRRHLLIFTSLVMVLESISLTAYGVLRGLQRFQYEAVGPTLHQLVILSVGTAGLLLTKNPLALGLAILAASVVNLTYALVHVKAQLAGFAPAKSSGLPWSVRTIAPFFLSGVLAKLYAYVDIVLLGILASDHFVGLYGAVYKLTFATQFLPIAFNSSVYPALSQAFHESTDTLRLLAERSLRFLLTVSLPISVLVVLNAHTLLAALFPKFQAASSALQILIISLPFLFSNFLLNSLLNATNLQVRNTWTLFVAVLLSLTLNWLLIPHLHHVGASLASLASTLTVTLLAAWFSRKHILWNRATSWFAVRVGLAAGLAGVISWLVAQYLHVFIALGVGGLAYVTSLFLLRAWSRTDVLQVIRSMRRSRT